MMLLFFFFCFFFSLLHTPTHGVDRNSAVCVFDSTSSRSTSSRRYTEKYRAIELNQTTCGRLAALFYSKLFDFFYRYTRKPRSPTNRNWRKNPTRSVTINEIHRRRDRENEPSRNVKFDLLVSEHRMQNKRHCSTTSTAYTRISI